MHTGYRFFHLALCIGLMGSLQAWADERPVVSDTHQPIQALARLSSLKKTTARAFKAPIVHEFFTTSGTRVLFSPAPELPIVDVRISFAAGSARDVDIPETLVTQPNAVASNTAPPTPASTEPLFGLASLTARLLDEGTTTHSTEDIAKTLESMGAELSVNAYRDMFNIDLRTLAYPHQRDAALTLLSDILQNANFPEESITRIFDNANIGLQQREEKPSSIANIRFFKALYGQHPYAHPSTGLPEALKRIKREHLMAFKQQFLVAKNANLSITGQLSLSEAQQLAERITASMPLGSKAAALPKASPLPQAATQYIPFKSTQSTVIIGQPAIDRSQPIEQITLAVGNEVLGGGDFNAMLMQELREKRGFTYGAYSQFSPMEGIGPFIISYSTKAEHTLESIQVAQQTLQRFLKEPLHPTVLEDVKQGLLKSYPISFASNSAKLDYLAMIGFYSLPTNYLELYPEWVTQVTAKDVHAAMLKTLNPEHMLTVIVGDCEPCAHLTSP